LVHAGKAHGAAEGIFARNRPQSLDRRLGSRLEWVAVIADFGPRDPPATPFTEAELPEVVASLRSMSDINRFSHVVMAASPVSAPFGLRWAKSALLRLFGAIQGAVRAGR
jgi:hypothetical protein